MEFKRMIRHGYEGKLTWINVKLRSVLKVKNAVKTGVGVDTYLRDFIILHWLGFGNFGSPELEVNDKKIVYLYFKIAKRSLYR